MKQALILLISLFFMHTTFSAPIPNALEESKRFFEENKKKEGVVTLPTGVQYKVIQAGKGTTAGPHDFVTIHYKGTFLNGTEFDSSYKNKEPVTFDLDNIIPGLSEALQRMQPGAKWIIYIPPALAYGVKGVKDKIPPNTALVFEVELMSVLREPPMTDEDNVEQVTGQDKFY